MRWPWLAIYPRSADPERETRDSSYADEVVKAILSQASGGDALPSATAAMETAAGYIARAFSSAEVSGGGNSGLLTPDILAMIGRELIASGNFVGRIRPTGIEPAQSWDITGAARPASWRYRLTLGSPSGSLREDSVRARSVLHIRYAPSSSQPWRGRSPVTIAANSGRLSAEVVTLLADEISGPRGYLLPVPDTAGRSKTLDTLRGDIAALKGRLATMESAQSMAANAGRFNSREWEPRRVGGNPPEGLVTIAERATMELLAACGIPPNLIAGAGAAASLREAWRIFLFGTLAPLGRLVEQEARLKLAPDTMLGWADLRASDLSGRARAFQSLVGGGMEVERAAALSGLLEGDD